MNRCHDCYEEAEEGRMLCDECLDHYKHRCDACGVVWAENARLRRLLNELNASQVNYESPISGYTEMMVSNDLRCNIRAALKGAK